MELTIDYTLRRSTGYVRDVTIRADVELGDPPYPTSDRSNPAYADHGEPAYCDILDIRTEEGIPIREDRLTFAERVNIEHRLLAELHKLTQRQLDGSSRDDAN